MRERVRIFGGRLEAGAQPTGGFRIHAILPIGEDAG
jgi:signal transduction histidine kinase